MKTRVILIEERQARGRYEETAYGHTETKDGVTRVFLNSRQSQGEMIDTFFHELTHAYFQWRGTPLNWKEEEKIARLVGNIVEPCFRRGLKKTKG